MIHYPTPAPARCLTCTAPAESPKASVFQLCARCADARYPGSDSAAYAHLVTAYGYPR